MREASSGYLGWKRRCQTNVLVPVSIQEPSFRVWDIHYIDKSEVRSSYFYNGNTYTARTTFLPLYIDSKINVLLCNIIVQIYIDQRSLIHYLCEHGQNHNEILIR